MAWYRQSVYYDHRNHDRRQFRVFINEGEMEQIKKWTLKKDNIETGGDLFGLWIDKHTAVVQFVLGPGVDCRRTSASFYQDVNYLEKAGKYLTNKHGLCNIGEWHSHHRMSLTRPSRGDENTVWGNMPQLNLSRFIVFIATIQDAQVETRANVNCFLFETDHGKKLPVLKGKFSSVSGNSPFRMDNVISCQMKQGAESLNKITSFEEKQSWKRVHESERKKVRVDPEVQRSIREEPQDGATTSCEAGVTMKVGVQNRKFQVFIHQGEMEQIKKWTLKKDNIETGGDLFGLWIDKHTAVVQFVLGPGVDCRRTSASFYQDVNYLEKAGKYLTKQHGLCNIGQWHSHHRINLPRPSGGDENIVWGNMGKHGLSRYIVFIATVQEERRGPKAKVNCFLFEINNGRQLPVLRADNYDLLPGNSSLRFHETILQEIRNGAESMNKIELSNEENDED